MPSLIQDRKVLQKSDFSEKHVSRVSQWMAAFIHNKIVRVCFMGVEGGGQNVCRSLEERDQAQ